MKNKLTEELLNELENDHTVYSLDTPLRKDAFALSDEEKIGIIAGHFEHHVNAGPRPYRR